MCALEVGLVKIRAAEIRTFKMRFGTIRVREDRLVEVCAAHAEAGENRAGEVGVAEIVAVQWTAGRIPQVCSGKHRMQVRVSKAPLVPSISSRCQPRHLTVSCLFSFGESTRLCNVAAHEIVQRICFDRFSGWQLRRKPSSFKVYQFDWAAFDRQLRRDVALVHESTAKVGHQSTPSISITVCSRALFISSEAFIGHYVALTQTAKLSPQEQ